mgnify:CR=1 FL=1
MPHPAPTSGPVWPSDFLPIWAKMESLRRTKPEIRDAVESIFDVKVLKVNTLNREGKRKRNRGLPTFGKRPDVKRAYVTLVEGESIELFEV